MECGVCGPVGHDWFMWKGPNTTGAFPLVSCQPLQPHHSNSWPYFLKICKEQHVTTIVTCEWSTDSRYLCHMFFKVVTIFTSWIFYFWYIKQYLRFIVFRRTNNQIPYKINLQNKHCNTCQWLSKII